MLLRTTIKIALPYVKENRTSLKVLTTSIVHVIVTLHKG
jgi:hypothetical protein